MSWRKSTRQPRWFYLKEGVSIKGLRHEAYKAAEVASRLHRRHTNDWITVTSTTEGKHSVKRSAHYRGDAVDLRIWHLTDPAAFTEELSAELGEDYVVLLESDHIHVHWSPVYHERS